MSKSNRTIKKQVKMEVTGILKAKFDTQKVSEKFSKREFVITTEHSTPYPQHVSFQVTQDKCSLLDQFEIGAEMKIQFNLRGREWSGPQGIKFFNTLEAWKIEPFNAVKQEPDTPVEKDVNNSSEDKEDLPF